ncbi:MAG: hypothetical protein ACOH5I_18210 [Oligoflexus sp.]
MRIRPMSLRLLFLLFTAGNLAGCSIFAGGEDQMEDDLFDTEMNTMDEGDEEAGENEEAAPELAEESNEDSSMDTMMSSGGFDGEGFDNLDSDALMGDMGSPVTTEGTEIVTDDSSAMGGGLDSGLGMGMDSGLGTNSNTPAPMASPPPASSPMPASGNTQVFYASSGGELVDTPNGQNVVGSLRAGDPVLVTLSGEWANVVNRGWIKRSQLSNKPVGRNKPKRSWDK